MLGKPRDSTTTRLVSLKSFTNTFPFLQGLCRDGCMGTRAVHPRAWEIRECRAWEGTGARQEVLRV